MSHDCQCDTSEWTGTHNSYKFHLQFRIAYFPMLLLMMIGLGIGSAEPANLYGHCAVARFRANQSQVCKHGPAGGAVSLGCFVHLGGKG